MAASQGVRLEGIYGLAGEVTCVVLFACMRARTQGGKNGRQVFHRQKVESAVRTANKGALGNIFWIARLDYPPVIQIDEQLLAYCYYLQTTKTRHTGSLSHDSPIAML